MVGPPPRELPPRNAGRRLPRGLRADDWWLLALLVCGAVAVVAFALRLFLY